MVIGTYSIGLGDRFGHQGVAQLSAIKRAKKAGVNVVPVWNKSYREHTIIRTRPADTRAEADAAVKALDWDEPYFVDADHVSLKIIEPFIPVCDFFTLDVADYIGERADETAVQDFVTQNSKYIGRLSIPSIEQTFRITKDLIRAIGAKYLCAIEEANRIYQHLVKQKGAEHFVTEVSMDETDEPQTPVELFFILAALSARNIPVQTIAPKFSGRFNKGVDYVGDRAKFTQEFEQDVAVIQFAIREFSLPSNLKLSVHSGSDKFSLYAPMRAALQKFETGLHLKTAGTTWLEELIGLALAGGEGLDIAQDVYRQAYNRYDELARPYASVIDMDMRALPSPVDVDGWDGRQYAETLRHDQTNKKYNPHFRQLLHVSYKVAAEMGDRYLNALERYEHIVAENVSTNIYERHIKPLFLPV